MTGYSHYTSNGTSVKNIRYVDPQYGNVKFCTYEQFKDGSFNDRKYDGTIWIN